jgi:hypothetical protein
MASQTQNGDRLYRLLQSIQARTHFDHPVAQFRIIETHISYVLLTGPYAYKFKKPLDLTFLDFRTLARRKFFCEEEVRLNTRLAPALYIGVVAFTGAAESPELNGAGPVLEYAVKMVQFSAADEAPQLLMNGSLTAEDMNELARQLADFHRRAAVADPASEYGAPERVLHDATDNFQALRALPGSDARYGKRLHALQNWTEAGFERLRQTFSARQEHGFIRECHGDLHLGNIVRHGGRMLIFDCVEFSPALRWIDVMNDLAFLLMDLHENRRPELAHRLLNQYLQSTGDYAGLLLLRFYMVYRALVRSKVAGIRLGQSRLERGDADRAMRGEHAYIDLAWDFIHPPPPVLLITHGLSGSGKSTYSRLLADRLAAIWIRSDVERKRLHGLRATERSDSEPGTGLYSPESTSRTYRRLADLAGTILNAGYTVIVDAAFLQQHTRTMFQNIAAEAQSQFLILDCQAEAAALQARVAQRASDGVDASEADARILAYQITQQEPLDELETAHSINLHTTSVVNAETLLAAIAARRDQRGAGDASGRCAV